MPLVVCLHSNIFDEDGQRRERGASWDASEDFVNTVLAGDAAAGRQPRLAVIEQPVAAPEPVSEPVEDAAPEPVKKRGPGRPRKVRDDED